ncbi:trifunctional glycosyltransferase/class I SAM-dependent methyltransferase/polysaccharide deacetylase [Nostoc sp. UHCC 0302]|uniref:trifunctional glycosyltransferase/class I SAM-dependent methyltransferase/polysaccharide deacetylase n=1 Tax=Nostoc sp. UHCC 0302 TaxID=3134896 RepID=UPI00311CCDD8
MLKVSVIIPAYDCGETIRKTLSSLLVQTYTEWEAIVVDDGSSDDTLVIATQFAQQDSRIQVLSQVNSGVCAARNAGIHKAKFEWLLFLDADDWILPQHLERLIQAIKDNPSLDAVYSRWTKVASNEQPIVDEEFSFQPSTLFAALARNCVLAIHCCIVRKTIVREVGGFDTTLLTCEDWDFWQKIARTGSVFGAIPDASACYRIRPNSASTNRLQIFTDGLRVITTGHSPDPRVPNPSPAYVRGMSAAELPGVKLAFLCWTAGFLLSCGEDAIALLDVIPEERDPGLCPYTIALCIFSSAFQPQCHTSTSASYELWQRLETDIYKFLTALETQSMAPALTRRVCIRLENLILDHSTNPRPVTVGSTYAVAVEVTEPISDITAPATTGRLHCTISIEGKRLGSLILPICDGFVASYVLQDAIAAKFAWEILGHFFQRTIYHQLTIKSSTANSSVWRGSLCLADNLPSDQQLLWAVLHDHIGWTVFLQELWQRPHWLDTNFYSSRLGKKTIFRELQMSLFQGSWKSAVGTLVALQQRVDKDTFTVEVSDNLPNLSVSAEELIVIPTVGGVPLGSISVEVEGGKVSSQQLRAAIIKESGLELMIAAVREGLLGRGLAEGTLRDRLVNKSVDPQYGSDVILSRYPSAIGTSVSRRAMFPKRVLNDLMEAGVIVGEPVIKRSGNSKLPERLIYAPEFITSPTKIVPKFSPKVERVPKPATVNLREYFETLFTKQADPWQYTSPYEQKKYEQTLALLPSKQFNKALEVACAEGHFTAQLAPRVDNLVAVDISQVALERAAQRCADCKNVTFQLFDLTQDPIPDCFDLIICSEVLYYVGGFPQLQAFARKVVDALNTDGYFITAHANLVVDQPDKPGYNWGHPFGAKVIGETFAKTHPLQLIKELRTPLYRVQLFQAGNYNQEPEIIEIPQPTPPPPLAAANILWHGGSPEIYTNWEVVTDQLPILMYHRVHPKGCAATSPYRVTPEAFAEQLRYLRDAGFHSITLEQWCRAKTTRIPIPGRAVLITFDDGYQDFSDYAWPLLKQYGFSANVFLVAGAIAGTNHWDSYYDEEVPLLDWQEIRQLQDEGVQFGAHSVTHRHLTSLSVAEIVQEAVRSRSLLHQVLGHTPTAFAYPYGDTDSVVQHLIGACGYTFGLSCKSGLSHFHDSLLALPRIEIVGTDGLPEFIAKLNV